MKGASAEPCANTKSAPTPTISTMIGRSHIFFRARIKTQSSRVTLLFAMIFKALPDVKIDLTQVLDD